MTPPVAPEIETAAQALIAAIDQCLALGEFPTARQLCQQGLILAPDHAGLRFRRARLHLVDRKFAAAADDFRAVVTALPDNAQAWLELGRAAARTLAWADAAAALETSLKLTGPRADVLVELGHLLTNGGYRDKAIAAFRSSVALAPENAEAWNDLGARLVEAADFDNAAAAFSEALTRAPAHRLAAANLAVAEEWRGQCEAVIAARRRALASAPDDPALHQSLGAALLSFGHLGEGWIEHRWRLKNPAHKGWHRGLPKPPLTAASLSGQRVLMWSDQGLGDQILAAGLLHEAAAQADKVVYACEPRLMPLMARSFADVRAVPITEIHRGTVDLSDVDVSASISEIGAILRPWLAAFPKHAGYLKADPQKSAALKSRYGALPGRGALIGLSWRSVNEIAGQDKSVSLEKWRAILSVPQARFVCLQYGEARADVEAAKAAFGIDIFVDPAVDAIADVDAFAAQVAAMDMVVSTSNTTVHMAGALGIPTLCLTPRVEGRPWYWFAGREISPWYPSVRHIWQTRRGHWDDVIASAASGISRPNSI